MSARAAVVTTLINADKILGSFIKYHQSIGFDHIYLFFDDPNDKAIEKIRSIPNITITRNDDQLKKRWQKTKLYQTKKEYRNYIDSEAMSRQMLNMAVACQMAQEDKIDWLLHIDIDELFYLPNQSVSEHFEELTRNDIASVQYLNYEGIPEEFEIEDFFKDVTLFKKNPGHYSFVQQYQYKGRGRNDYFNYYKIGKSAARVDRIDVPLLHDVIVKNEKIKLRTRFYRYQNSARTFFKKIYNSRTPQFPAILHYPICGFGHFIDKYLVLGNFEDKWFGKIDVIPFHKKSRDIVMAGARVPAEKFYMENVMMEKTVLRRLLEEGVIMRIERPSELIH
jgi:hypothetical protein